ncbi:Sugar transporter STL1 [Cyphellophora attinorum]|uniref:Sugar transporter STL1 n=1 Tax=Cyphellophora attinorum TaxID=1664694 RepID=A0A0N0NIW3_9EURO|nr:Sugar transporter STL1 [Phialophora attinorum]KPI36291.1 Sugar transporter STL1 [Phialophora attinorum]
MFGIENLRGRRVRLLVTVVCGCSFSLFGYDQALYGGIASGPAFVEHFNHPSATLTGHTAAIYDIGCLLGAVFAFFIASRVGHRYALLLGSAIVTVGAVIQTSSVSIGMLIAGRVIGGIGNGLNTSVSPVYHAETSRTHSRGRAVIGELFILDLGWLTAQFVTFGFSFVKDSLQWRFPTIFQVFFLLPVFVILPWLPDSPRWLATKDRLSEAKRVLGQILDEDDSSPTFQSYYEEIQEVVKLEHAAEKVTIAEVWNGEGQNTYRLLLGCGIMCMQQIGGINIIAYYVVIIFQSLGLGNNLARILAACTGIGWLASNLASMLVIETWGRRKLLMLGGMGQFVTFLVAGIALGTGGDAKWAGIVVVTMVYLYFIVFAFAWQSIPFLYPAEIASLKYRARFYPMSIGTNWAFNYVVVLVTPVGLQNIGFWFYIIFAIFNFVNVFVVWFFYVETANKSLEQIDMMFVGEQHVDKKAMPPYSRLIRKTAARSSARYDQTQDDIGRRAGTEKLSSSEVEATHAA